MLVRGSRHCCCKPPKQCEQEVQFNPYNFDETEKPGTTFGLATFYDIGTSSVTLIGEGSLTTRVTSNPKKIFVHAHILDLIAGSGGITIRRIDSNDSVSLWYLGGTSYELRQGTTVLESITSTSGGEIKLELATPRESVTDVLVYIDGVLEHTETGVVFDMPDVLHLGLVTEGASGGDIRFGYLAVSPCLASTCEPYDQFCYADPWTAQTLTVPKMWYVNIPWPSDHGSNSWPDPLTDCALPGLDVLYPQDVYFKLGTDVVYYDSDEDAWQPVDGCKHAPFTPSKVTYFWDYNDLINETPYSLPPVPEGKFPYEYSGFCDNGTLANPRPVTIFPHSNDKHGDSFTSYTEESWILDVVFQNVGTLEVPEVEYKIRVTFNTLNEVIYESDWIEHNGGTIDSSITLSLTTNNSPYTGWDSSVYLQPNGGSKEFARRAMGCGEETCTPPVTPQLGQTYCMSVTLVDEADTPIDYSVPMDVGYNETTGSWEWTGFIGSWEHPTCGMMDSSSYKIHCVEPEEGASKQWVLDITTDSGTSRIPLSDDPEFGPVFDGTLDVFCTGETWDVFTPFPTVNTEEVDIFGCDPTTCRMEGWCVSGTASCDTGTCAQNSFGNFLVATSDNPPGVVSKIGDAFTGPYPIAVPSGRSVWLWEDGGGVHLAVYNGTTLIEEATPIDIDCDQGDKTFSLNDPALACCSGFGGVVITLTPCGGPIVHV